MQATIATGDPQMAPKAAYNLAGLLKQWGDAAGMRQAYQLAAASGHSTYAPKAQFHLGLQLYAAGDVAGARSAYQAAIDSGDPAMAPRAQARLVGHAGGASVGRLGVRQVAGAFQQETENAARVLPT
ncbi:MAG TPA: hypothetical protein VGM10_26090, partial [Actinocrinis sp.]